MSAVIDVDRFVRSQQGTTSELNQQDSGTKTVVGDRFHIDAMSADLQNATQNVERKETAQIPASQFQPIIRAQATYRFHALKRWEGVVVGINDTEFVSRLNNLDNAAEYQIEAVIPFEEITDSDRDLVQVGAVFYWTIGYRIEPGQKRSVSTIRFRRLPAWTTNDRQRLNQLTSEYDAIFEDPAR
jgi:hypothetical protein